ncbi:MAG: hypothetical protein FJ149_02395 [Euryarchaeota archaeon]|nr:hypothetical protein [Euryarchaeota archaeon]
MVVSIFNVGVNVSRSETGSPLSDGTLNTAEWVIESTDTIYRGSNTNPETIKMANDVTIEGTLYLSYVTLLFKCLSDGEYGLFVDEDGILYADHCTFGILENNHVYKFRIDGAAVLEQSTFSGMWKNPSNLQGGIQILSDDITVQECEISDSSVGIYILESKPVIQGNTVTGCDYGIVSVSDGVLEPPELVESSISQCDKGIYLEDSSSSIAGSDFDGCDYAIYCDGSSPTVTDCTITAPQTAPIYAKNDSDVTLIDTSFARGSLAIQDTSTVDVKWHFIPTIVDGDNEPIEYANVVITDWNDDPAFSGQTDEEGQTEEILLTELSQDSSSVEYLSPFTVEVTNNGVTNDFILPISQKMTMGICAGGDTDNDGLDDSEEGSTTIYSFEAEAFQMEAGQDIDDENAFNGKALAKCTNAPEIIDSRLTTVRAGTYKCYVRARADPAGSRMSIDIYSNSNHLVDDELHKISLNYDWYSTVAPDFTLASDADVTVTLGDVDATTSGRIFVDRIMLVQLKDSYNEPTGILGQVSDPVLADTDLDGLLDGAEARGDVYWFDTEDSPGQLTVVDDFTAGNGKAVSLSNGNTVTIPNPAVAVPAGIYQYELNARSQSTTSPPSIQLDIYVNDIMQSTLTTQITDTYNWYLSSEITLDGNQQSVKLKATATISGAGQIYADRAVLVQKRETGTDQLWQSETTNFKTSPAIGNEYIIVGSNDPTDGPKVYALSKDTGETVWSYTNQDIKDIKYAPAVFDGTVFFAADIFPLPQGPDRGGLYALDEKTGNPIWSGIIYDNVLKGTPAILGDMVLIGGSDNNMHAVDREDGDSDWDYNAGYQIITSPVVSGDKIFFGVSSASPPPPPPKLFCLDSMHNPLWTWDSDYALTTQPLVADGMVIFGASDNYLHAVSELDGTNLWTYNVGSAIQGTPICSNTRIIFGADDGLLYSLVEDTGVFSWSRNVDNYQPVRSYPIVVNGQVIVGVDSGLLQNVYSVDNTVVWTANPGNNNNMIRSSPVCGDIDSDGILEILVSKGGVVYALDGAGIYTRNINLWPQEGMDSCNNGHAQYQAPYIPTNPLGIDSDSDMVKDGDETGISWKMDRIETEDYTECYIQGGIKTAIRHQFNVNLTSTAKGAGGNQVILPSYVKMTENIPENGKYHILAEGIGSVEFQPCVLNNGVYDPVGGVEIPLTMADLREMENAVLSRAVTIELKRPIVLNPPNPNAEIPAIDPAGRTSELRSSTLVTKVNPAEPPIQMSAITGSIATRYWHIDQEYDLGMGVHELVLRIDDSLLTTSVGTFTVDTNEYEIVPKKIEINSDFLILQRVTYSGLDSDVDGDSLADGQELVSGLPPLNSDCDEDGISDKNEQLNGLNAELRDTDMDGIRDRVELGLGAVDTDPYTTWDTSEVKNQDQDTQAPATDPKDPDSDDDGLPDGSIEGWGVKTGLYWQGNEEWGPYGIILQEQDWIAQPWEREDQSGNGKVDAGETNPKSANSDGDVMPDGYERWFSLDPTSALGDDGDNGEVDVYDIELQSAYIYTNPWFYKERNDAQKLIPVDDALTNKYEYISGSNPREQDSDRDGLMDGGEVPVWKGEGFNCVEVRTNVPNGSRQWTGYGTINEAEETEWVWVKGVEYWYAEKHEDVDIDTKIGVPPYDYNLAPDADLFSGELPTNMHFVAYLQDTTVILAKSDFSEIYVWEPGTLVKEFFEGLRTGTVHRYHVKDPGEQALAPSTTLPLADYMDQEVYFSDPHVIDSDNDARNDGLELILERVGDHPNFQFKYKMVMGINLDSRNHDADSDGWCNARSLDSDSDGLGDRIESKCTVGEFDGRTGGTNAYNGDTDGDTTGDEDDPLPVDQDNDGLTGYNGFNNNYGIWLWFNTGTEKLDYDPHTPGTQTCTNNNIDTDSDGLLDGYSITLPSNDFRVATFYNWPILWTYDSQEDTYTFFGELSIGTEPVSSDTDGDGLNDELEYTHITDPVVADSDGDGLSDGTEDRDGDGMVDEGPWNGGIGPGETNPTIADTDNDGWSDWEEVTAIPATDPLNIGDFPMGSPYDKFQQWLDLYYSGGGYTDLGDSDGDDLCNLAEFLRGTKPTTEAGGYDTDNDDMRDGYEVQYGFDPLLADGALDKDGDGLWNKYECEWGTLPVGRGSEDSDGDGLWDGHNPITGRGEDLDNDGYHGGVPEAGETSPILPDTDSDFIPDRYEKDGSGWKYNIEPDVPMDADATGVSSDGKLSVGIDFNTGYSGTITITQPLGTTNTYEIEAMDGETSLADKITWIAVHMKYNKATIGIAEDNLALYWKDGDEIRIFADSARGEFTHVDKNNCYVWGKSTTVGTVTIGDYTLTDMDGDGLTDSLELERGSRHQYPFVVGGKDGSGNWIVPPEGVTWTYRTLETISGETVYEAHATGATPRIFEIDIENLDAGEWQCYVLARATSNLVTSLGSTGQSPRINLYYDNYDETDVNRGHWRALAVGRDSHFKWVSSGIFKVAEGGTVTIYGENPYQTGYWGLSPMPDGIRVCAVMLVEKVWYDVISQSRQTTIISMIDTDMDGVLDGGEVYMDDGAPLAYWFEAEDYPTPDDLYGNKYATIFPSSDASMGRELIPVLPGAGFEVRNRFFSKSERGEYRLYVRARISSNFVNPSSDYEPLSVWVNGQGDSRNRHINIGSYEYHWYMWSESFGVFSDTTIALCTYAKRAPNVVIDKVLLLKTKNYDLSETKLKDIATYGRIIPDCFDSRTDSIPDSGRDTDDDGFYDGEETTYYSSDPVIFNQKWALLVSGTNLYPRFVNSLDYWYHVLKDHYSFDEIRTLHPGYTDQNEATVTNVRPALSDWLASKSDENDIVLIYFTAYGSGVLKKEDETYEYKEGRIDTWPYDEGNEHSETDIHYDFDDDQVYEENVYGGVDEGIMLMERDYWDDWFVFDLANIKCSKMIIILQASYSGGFIEECSGENRIIMTSTKECALSSGDINPQDGYSDWIGRVLNILNGEESIWDQDAVQHHTYHTGHPVNADQNKDGRISIGELSMYSNINPNERAWLDDNGDAIPCFKEQSYYTNSPDGIVANEMFLGRYTP